MTIRIAIPAAFALALSTIAALGQQQPEGEQAPRTHILKASPKTVAWGHYHAKTPPVLRIKSGDAVEFHTLLTNSPTRLERARRSARPGRAGPSRHLPRGERQGAGRPHPHRADLRRRGRAGRRARGANPGRSSWRSPMPTTPSARGAAPSPKTSRRSKMKIIPLDRERMVAPFGDGIEIPLKPVLRQHGRRPARSRRAGSTAPRPASTPATSTTRNSSPAPPCSSPSTSPGALFQVGDGHAAPGGRRG